MKKYFSLTILIFALSFAFPTSSFAQSMMGDITGANNPAVQNDDGHTAREEAEGKAVWEKLQAKELTCKDLSDDNFEALGEYFMGQMAGASHEAMNSMMIQMMGKESEGQMHIVMGKRMSNCEPEAPMPQKMMSSGMMGSLGTNPMSWGLGLGWVFMILFWSFVILAIFALIKWLIVDQWKGGTRGKSSLEILKERYAKGEIDKKEFEEKKKDLI